MPRSSVGVFHVGEKEEFTVLLAVERYQERLPRRQYEASKGYASTPDSID
ncbi:MAG: hypothetical protein U1D30_21110 [Planctomycetota bacterium]